MNIWGIDPKTLRPTCFALRIPTEEVGVFVQRAIEAGWQQVVTGAVTEFSEETVLSSPTPTVGLDPASQSVPSGKTKRARGSSTSTRGARRSPSPQS
jgi:hypothetical protein